MYVLPPKVIELLIFIIYRTCLVNTHYVTLCWVDLFIDVGKLPKLVSRAS